MRPDQRWRPDPGRDLARDAFKRASRAFMLRVAMRLEARGWSAGAIAEVWDEPVGRQWFWPIMGRAALESRSSQ